MSLPAIAAIVLVALALGYRFYGRLIAREYNLATTADTPAHIHRDDLDFVPTKPFYLFGQHFSAIAAAGPIVGPILATYAPAAGRGLRCRSRARPARRAAARPRGPFGARFVE